MRRVESHIKYQEGNFFIGDIRVNEKNGLGLLRHINKDDRERMEFLRIRFPIFLIEKKRDTFIVDVPDNVFEDVKT